MPDAGGPDGRTLGNKEIFEFADATSGLQVQAELPAVVGAIIALSRYVDADDYYDGYMFL